MNFISEIFGYPLGFLMQGCYFLVQNYAVALLLFTLVTKILLFPLAVKQQKSTAQMAVFQPKITEINKKFATDKRRQQEEMMKLYEEYGYNPTGGCLPMLIQFPILFGLIDVVYKPLTHIVRIPSDVIQKALTFAGETLNLELSKVNPQVSLINAVKADPGSFEMFNAEQIHKITNINFNFFGIDMSATPHFALEPLVVVPILAGLTMILSSWASMKFSGSGQAMQGNPAGGMSKFMLYGMSLFSVVFAFQVPAGVGLYWIFSNVLLILQSYLLNKIYNPKKLAVEYEAKVAAIREAKKKKVKVEVKDQEGHKKTVEKVLTEKELNRLRLAKARELDEARYGGEGSKPQDSESK